MGDYRRVRRLPRGLHFSVARKGAVMTPHPRTRLVNFRVTQEEMERLIALATRAEMSVSDYVRTQLVLGREQVSLHDRMAALEAAVKRMSARQQGRLNVSTEAPSLREVEGIWGQEYSR